VVSSAALVATVLLVALVLVIRGPASPVAASATPQTSEAATATPSPTVWRLEGVVMDEQGKPVEGVCVGLGPSICTDVNPRTDAKGRWYIDLPKAVVEYDFHFTKPGFQQFDMHVRAVTSQTFAIRLVR
jgi:hypothetical protein